jgi:hypothetical protein
MLFLVIQAKLSTLGIDMMFLFVATFLFQPRLEADLRQAMSLPVHTQIPICKAQHHRPIICSQKALCCNQRKEDQAPLHLRLLAEMFQA